MKRLKFMRAPGLSWRAGEYMIYPYAIYEGKRLKESGYMASFRCVQLLNRSRSLSGMKRICQVHWRAQQAIEVVERVEAELCAQR